MPEEYSVDQIGLLVDFGAELVNVGDKIIHKKGIFALFNLSDEASALAGLDVELLKKQAADVSPEERAQLNDRFKNKLVLINKELEAKIEAGADLVDDAIDLGIRGIKLFNEGIALVEQVKELFDGKAA